MQVQRHCVDKRLPDVVFEGFRLPQCAVLPIYKTLLQIPAEFVHLAVNALRELLASESDVIGASLLAPLIGYQFREEAVEMIVVVRDFLVFECKCEDSA